jgi:hypothetical protein
MSSSKDDGDFKDCKNLRTVVNTKAVVTYNSPDKFSAGRGATGSWLGPLLDGARSI